MKRILSRRMCRECTDIVRFGIFGSEENYTSDFLGQLYAPPMAAIYAVKITRILPHNLDNNSHSNIL